MKTRFSRRDGMVILILAILCIALFVLRNRLTKTQGDSVTITVANEVYGEYSLAEDQVIPIVIDGETTDIVTIENGAAYMSEASCPDQLCVNMGEIQKDQETIVCLPYQIVITVHASEERLYDSVAQ